MKETIQILEYLRSKTDTVILFHSLAGKDSIVLLDLLCKRFKKVQCVFMFTVKDMEHLNFYKQWALKKYPNCDFIETPSYDVYSIIKNGLYGTKKDPKQRLYTLSDIANIQRKNLGIDWVVYGTKKNDSLNRRLMLKGYYLEGINEKTKNVYPLTSWSNKDCLAYIQRNKLLPPVKYDNRQSSGVAVDNGDFLYFLKRKYPQDLEKVFKQYPLTQAILQSYDQARNSD